MTDEWDDHGEARSLLAMVKDDPVQATLGCTFALQQLEQDREEKLNHFVTVPFATALRLETDWEAWVRYINTPELWAHRSRKFPKPRRDKDHKHVLGLVFEATFAQAGKSYGSGWWYARALEDAFIKRVQPEDLPNFIKDHISLRKMYDAAIKNKPRRKPGLHERDDYFDLSSPEPEATDESHAGDQSHTGDLPPKPHGGTEGHEPPVSDLAEPPIQLSKKLIRRLRKFPQGRGKKLPVFVRAYEDRILVRLPKKPKPSKEEAPAKEWTTFKPWEEE